MTERVHLSRVAFAFCILMKRVQLCHRESGLDMKTREARLTLGAAVQKWALVLDIDPDAAACYALSMLSGLPSEEFIAYQDDLKDRVTLDIGEQAASGLTPLFPERVESLVRLVCEDTLSIEALHAEKENCVTALVEGARTETGGLVVTEAVSRFCDVFLEDGRRENLDVFGELLVKTLVEAGNSKGALAARALIDQALIGHGGAVQGSGSGGDA